MASSQERRVAYHKLILANPHHGDVQPGWGRSRPASTLGHVPEGGNYFIHFRAEADAIDRPLRPAGGAFRFEAVVTTNLAEDKAYDMWIQFVPPTWSRNRGGTTVGRAIYAPETRAACDRVGIAGAIATGPRRGPLPALYATDEAGQLCVDVHDAAVKARAYQHVYTFPAIQVPPDTRPGEYYLVVSLLQAAAPDDLDAAAGLVYMEPFHTTFNVTVHPTSTPRHHRSAGTGPAGRSSKGKDKA